MAGDSKGTRNRTSGRTSAENHHDGMTLCDAISLWPTPQTDSFRSRGGDRRNEKGLDRMARDWPPSGSSMWMTPTARDHKDGATSLANTPVNGLLGRQVLTIPRAGDDTCDARRSLNPAFVEALMGWPGGWTGFGSAATAWSRWLSRMRCELSQLSSPVDEGAAD
jgi:DNA (cytosine-5)-methyltransferase 1